jgi:DNA repair photolyase
MDVKICDKPIKLKELEGKSVFLSSVTDCYNKYEKEFEITKGILEQIRNLNSEVTISTKSDLILRDIELLKQFKNLIVSFSVNTLDSDFQRDMDRASPLEDRLRALKILHSSGIRTVLFVSPIFPYITDFRAILEQTKDYINEYWFENLNLRGDYKYVILTYLRNKYSEFYEDYDRIYNRKDNTYWKNLENEIREYCERNGINYKIYFYHEKIRK